jgi:isoleucyl-tRNA synthetase
MPVWKGTDKDGKELIKVVGSYAELKELSGVELDDYHRPWIDDVTFEIDGVKYTRIDKVLDCWFESGSMPFAQFHYPFENVDKFEQSFPGDYIAEYVGQVRAWFYYLHAVSTGLFGQNSFKNVIVTGNLAGDDGRKMSKSFGNYTDPNELMDEYSADSLRFLLLGSTLLNGEDYALLDKEVATTARKLSMVWNMYDFFTMYAEVDGWEWDGNLDDPTPDLHNPLDQWIVSRMHQLTEEIERHMERYDLPNAVKPILEFLDDASNWYVRRSRKRFWKTDNDSDKDAAYRTLHYVLVQLSIAMAPFTPFLSEELYQKLTGGESVHLVDWPEVGHINELILKHMAYVKWAVNEGLSLRAKEGIKVRQPLSAVHIEGAVELSDDLKTIIAEELNVKQVQLSVGSEDQATIQLSTKITAELKREGLMREIVRHVQSARKKAGLNVDDRIELSLSTDDKVTSEAIKEHQDTIKAETLATTLHDTKKDLAYHEEVKVEGQMLEISLAKA